ncbi:hypothetical protein QVD17_21700 [Tagetes erecta]|uniref:DUF4005 domain-containing protein n=1 Tax=Tagetes erecta TaxID=13708 RepID=A0AAD8NTM9_TARER|nr:hypothetical protein QVD17_21700 [Tagetes erecta]
MGNKKPAFSWFTAFKRAFRSPTKQPHKNTNHNQHHDLDDDDEKPKREKKKWLFRKPTAAPENETVQVAPAPEAMEVVGRSEPPVTYSRDYYAAIIVQTAFRGYLARRALRALKGLVKLQALVRGYNVRKQAKMTLHCMQALVRVQARVLDQRMKQSDQSSRKSILSDSNSTVPGYRYHQDVSDKRSMSRDSSSIADDWDERPHTIDEVKAKLQSRAARHEKTLSQALSQETPRNAREPSIGSDYELGLGDRHQRLDRRMGSKPRDTRPMARTSTDQRDGFKTVEVDTSQPYSHFPPNNSKRSGYQHNHHHHHHRAAVPVTPSPSKTRPIHIRPASPEDSNQSQTPSLKSNYSFNNSMLHQHPRGSTSGGPMPNYMAATESAKARVRSQSTPRQRPSTPERDGRFGLAKKRVFFPVLDPHHRGNVYIQQNVRSPSFSSVNEQQSSYTESIAVGEVSPCSTTYLRRWLR